MATKTGRTKTGRKKKDVLAGRDPTMQLYRAVRRYVESGHGIILVIGVIEVQHWPGEPEHVYRVAVKFMGRMAVFADPHQGERSPK